MQKTRSLHLIVSREECWYPKVEVPAHLDDYDALEWAREHLNHEIYNEYLHKHTYDSDTTTEVLPQKE